MIRLFNRVWKVAPNAIADSEGLEIVHASTLQRHQDLVEGRPRLEAWIDRLKQAQGQAVFVV